MNEEIDLLKEKIKSYYQNSLATGQGMWQIEGLEEGGPWLALTGLGHGLKVMGFDVKSTFQGRKLLDLVKETQAFDVASAGLPVYIRPSAEGDVPMAYDASQCEITRTERKMPLPRQRHNKPAGEAEGADGEVSASPLTPDPRVKPMKPYKLRTAYRALLAEGHGVADQDAPTDLYVDVKLLMEALGIEETPKEFTELWHNDLYVKWMQPNGAKGENPVCMVMPKNMAYLRLTDDVAFYPYDRFKNYWSALEPLKELALPENWGEKNQILDNYLRYTYAKVVEDGALVVSEDGKSAVWNTGLVNFAYQPIYCFLEQWDANAQWLFRSFCVEGQNDGKELVARIPKTALPQRVKYFNSVDDLLFEPSEDMLSMDYEHMVVEHPSRLPQEWLQRRLSADDCHRGFGETDEQFDERLGELIKADQEAYAALVNDLEKSAKIALLRCSWNYKTPLPFFDPRFRRNGWFLPLCTENTTQPFAALVVTRLPSGTYQGQTLYRVDWAYPCARLVCPPQGDWLNFSKAAAGYRRKPAPGNWQPRNSQQGFYQPRQQGYGRNNGFHNRFAQGYGQPDELAADGSGMMRKRHVPAFSHGEELEGQLNPAGLHARTERKVLLDDGRWIWIDNNQGFREGFSYETIGDGPRVALTVKESANRAGAPLFLATDIHPIIGD